MYLPGWIYDATGSYNTPFHVSGIPVILGAVTLFFIPWAQRTSQGTNIMQAAIESPYASISEDRLPSEQEMFLIGGSSGSSPEGSVQTLTNAKTEKSYIVMDRANQSSYLVVGRDDTGKFTVQHVSSVKKVPDEVVKAIEAYKKKTERMPPYDKGRRMPRRRLVSDCRPESSSPPNNKRKFHSLQVRSHNQTPIKSL